MNPWLNEFVENEISFSWHELKLGRFGYSAEQFELEAELDDCFVVQFTAEYLSKHLEESNPYLWELGSLLQPYDKVEIFELLHQAATSEEKDRLAYYKWRWILVNQFIRELDRADYVNGLLNLSEFYLDLGSPSDFAFRHQSTIEGMSPERYYTREMFDLVLSEISEWLELEQLKFQESSFHWERSNERKRLVVIPLTEIQTSKELHTQLAKALGFPYFYGKNWNAFWDAITGLVALPETIVFEDWLHLEKRLPEEAGYLKRLLEEYVRQSTSAETQLLFH